MQIQAYQQPLGYQPTRSVSGEPSGGESPSPASEKPRSGEAQASQESARTQQDPLQDPSSPESQQLRELQARDREVRAHEQAHLAAAGPYAAGGPSYTFQRGPDGRMYAIGGQVNVDTSPIPGDPEATLRKAQTLQRAAMAPAEPSGQDRAVSASAAQMASQARQDINAERTEEAFGDTSNSTNTNSAANNDQQRLELEQRIKESGAIVGAANSSTPTSLNLFA